MPVQVSTASPRRMSKVRLRLCRGFTLIELLVVMAIIALLLTLAVPRYFKHVDQAKETVLKHNLHTLRNAIDNFYADTGRYPASLDELVEEQYLREIPIDPMNNRRDTWKIIPPPTEQEGEEGVYDVESGAEKNNDAESSN